MSKVCFHCEGTNLCTCVACHRRTKDGIVSGPCGWCAGRKLMQDYLDWAERHGYSFSQMEHWYVYKPEAPAHPERRFRPFEDFAAKYEKGFR